MSERQKQRQKRVHVCVSARVREGKLAKGDMHFQADVAAAVFAAAAACEQSRSSYSRLIKHVMQERASDALPFSLSLQLMQRESDAE